MKRCLGVCAVIFAMTSLFAASDSFAYQKDLFFSTSTGIKSVTINSEANAQPSVTVQDAIPADSAKSYRGLTQHQLESCNWGCCSVDGFTVCGCDPECF